MDDLFSYRANEIRRREEPLAARMRPLTIDEIVGQRHIIGRERLAVGIGYIPFPFNLLDRGEVGFHPFKS